MDDATESSLSFQLEALANVRRNHVEGLARRQAELENLEMLQAGQNLNASCRLDLGHTPAAQLAKEKQEKNQLTVKINKLLAEICVLEEDGCKRKLNVTNLENEVSRAIEECENVKSDLTQKEKEHADLNQKVYQYMKKMESHQCKVRIHEKEFPTLKDLESARQHFEDLKSKRELLLNKQNDLLRQLTAQGKASAEIKKNIEKAESDAEELRTLVQDFQSELEDIENERNKTEMSNAILKKKNAALLTRLKRQADEQKEKHEQLSSHIGNIQDEIAVIKAKLDKITHNNSY